MSLLDAIILGIVQGLSEFLPISSTGHLTLAGKFMGLINESNPAEWTAFIAVIQLGTLGSILIYFWNDVINIVKDFVNENLLKRVAFKEQSLNSRLGWAVIVGTIPIVVIGLGFKDIIEGALTKNLYVIATSLIVLALILALAEKLAKHNRGIEKVTLRDALIVGLAQAVALIPGSSRSGTTLTGGLFCGFNRETAARFSFLLSIPAIFASGMLELKQTLESPPSYDMLQLAVATAVSGVSGWFAIDFLLKYLRKNSTFLFIYYRIAVGVIILALLFSGIITP
ncbi:MAG: undecaprenyl-diphosphatase UppP [Ignavibacteriales bacterium]|nr:MAG: undecaprenyl-diphosphatase UppP [Ignavibacteriales bacterium]